MPMTLDQFGQTVKKKYPQYQGMSDTDVANKVIAKYPKYKSQISGSTPSTDQGASPDGASPLSQAGSAIKGTMGFLGNAAKSSFDIYQNLNKGFLKGVGSTLVGAGQLGAKAMEAGYDATIGQVTGKKAISADPLAKNLKEGVLKPEGTAQNIGFGAEQAAEFAAPIPGAAGIKAKAIGKLGEVVGEAPKIIQKGAEILGKAGLEGTEQAGRAAIQEGGVNDQVGVAGAIGAAAPALEAAGNIADHLGNFVYSRAVPTTITQAGKDMAKDLNIGEAVSKTGISFTRKGLLDKIVSSVRSLGSTLDSAIQTASKEGASYKIGDLIDETMTGLEDSALAKKMQLSPVDLGTAKQAVSDRLESYRQLYGDKILTPADIQKIKVDLGTGLSSVYQKALDVPVKAKALADMTFRSTLRKTIEKAVPAASDLNKQMAPLLEAAGRIAKKGAHSGYLTDIIAGGFAAGNVGDIISDPAGYLKKFAEGVLVKRLGTSTAAKTTTGAVLKALDKVIASPGFAQATRRLIQLSTQGGGEQNNTSDNEN